MGTTDKTSLQSSSALRDGYEAVGAAEWPVMDVGPYDSITLFVDVDPTGITTLDMRMLVDGYIMHKADSGSMVVDETSYTLVGATDNFIAFTIDTTGMKTLEVQFKADASGTINSIEWSREGSDNHTPKAL